MTPWLQGTSRDLSWQQPELTVVLLRDRRDTESKQDTLPHWLSGDMEMGIALWGRTCPHMCGPSWLHGLLSCDNLGEWTESPQFADV